MPKRRPWPWRIYLAIFFWITVDRALVFFSASSKIFWYFHVLIALDNRFIFPFLLSVLSILLNLLSIVPLIGFIERRKLLSRRFWTYVLIFRVNAELFGRSYDFKELQALRAENPLAAGLTTATMVLYLLPSYYAIAAYIHRWDRMCD